MSLNPGDRVAGLGDLSHPMEAEPGAARARPDPKQAMSKMARTLSELSLERRQLLGRLMQLEGLDPRNLPIAPRGKDSGDLPLSCAHQRLWFLDQLEPGSPRYNIPSAFQIAGTLDLGALERALHEIARRHEILRTTFPALDGKPVQVTAPQCSLGISVVDLEALPETEKQARLRALREREALTPFDLSEGPLVRAAVVRLGNHLHQLLLTMHHIVSDGWSGGIFHRELSILYDAFLTGRQSPLPELPVQYADFARWQRELLQGEVLESLLTYWRARLVDAPLVLELPTDRPRPAVQSFRGAMQFFTIPASLSEALRAF